MREVWLAASAAPETWVAVTDGWERKIASRLAHTSPPDASRLVSDWQQRAAPIGAPITGLVGLRAIDLVHRLTLTNSGHHRVGQVGAGVQFPVHHSSWNVNDVARDALDNLRTV